MKRHEPKFNTLDRKSPIYNSNALPVELHTPLVRITRASSDSADVRLCGGGRGGSGEVEWVGW